MGGRARGRGRGRERWGVGVDLGGSWLRVLALDRDGRARVATARAPARPDLPARLGASWRRLGLRGPGVACLVVAAAGVWTAAERRALRRRLRSLARRVRVLSDVEAAYRGALGDRAGILVLAGTGSIALGRDRRGRWARAGGLGPLLGDDGSAFWIGREWLRAAARDEDFGRARRLATGRAPVARIASLAPAVLARARRGHGRARLIVRSAQEALAALCVSVARRAGLGPPVAVSWSGSLLEDARFRAGVWRAARRLGLPVAPSPPRATPAEAAARLARGLGSVTAPRRPGSSRGGP